MGIFSKAKAAAVPGELEKGDVINVAFYTAVPAAQTKFSFPKETDSEDALKEGCLKFEVPFNTEHYGLYFPSPKNQWCKGPLSGLGLRTGDKLQIKMKPSAPVHASFHVELPAVVLGRLKKLKSFADRDDMGRTYLHLAAMQDPKVLRYCLKKKGINVNDLDDNGASALHYAAKSGDLKRIELLFQNQADSNAQCKGGRTVLHYLAEARVFDDDKYGKALALLHRAGLSCFQRDGAGLMPPHAAAASGNTAALRHWVEAHLFDPDTPMLNGETCLHIAVRNSDLIMVRLLLKYGCDKYALSQDGVLAQDIAEELGLRQIIEALSDVKETEMIEAWKAVKDGNDDAAKKIADAFVEKKHVRNLNTMVVWAATRFRFDLLDHLLNIEGVCPRHRVEGGRTALSSLVRTNNKDIVEDERYVPLMKKCIEKGSSPNEKNDSGDTLLHIAALASNRVAVGFLMDSGAFTNTVNFNGFSELHYAVVADNDGLVNDLLRGNSDPNLASISGETAKALAQRIHRDSIVTLLDSNLAAIDPNATNVFQPNAVKLTLVRGSGLIAKDDNGLSDPYCVVRHRLGDNQAVVQTETVEETLSPEFNAEFLFIIKKDNVFYRDVLVDIYDFDQPDEDAGGVARVDDFMGRATVTLDPRERSQTCSVEVQDSNGKAGVLEFSLEYEELSAADVAAALTASYKPFDVLEDVNAMLSSTGSKGVGMAKRALGYKPKFPIMIVPGLASSALVCWETDKEAWKQERVWVDPFKIGKAAAFQKLSKKMRGAPKKKKAADGSIIEDDSEDLNKDQRRWLKHILLAADGWSDPPGIKVRPVDGIGGCDYLSDSPLAKKATYVFGHVIRTLADAGYDNISLDAAPYDWRIPPEKLEERDSYFTRLKTRVEMMRKLNNEKVVLMAHSMGNRCVQYFLEWLKKYDEAWIDENIHAFLALGPPFLGACKSVRAVVSGDCMGLDVFLTNEEGRTMARQSGSLPWLFPMVEEQFPDCIARINKSYKKGDAAESKAKLGKGASMATLLDSSAVKEVWEENCVDDLVKQCAPSSYEYYENFYMGNPMYLDGFDQNKFNADLPPILSPPPVKNLWVISGVNLPTEVSFYFRPHVTARGDTRYVLDSTADKYSAKKIAGVNPRGLQITGGMGFETKNTYQPSAGRNRSGDGTVTYCSLNWAANWKEQAQANDLPLDVQIVEVEGAEHRAMLAHDAVFSAIIDFVCEKPIG